VFFTQGDAGNSYTDATRTLVLVGANFVTDVSVGDVLIVGSTTAARNGIVSIQTVTNDTTVILSSALGADLATAAITYVRVIRQRNTYFEDNVKADMATAPGKLYAFQLRASGIMGLNKYLPLAQLGGLRIEMTLEANATALISPTAGRTYTINSPVMYYDMLTPSDQLAATLSKAQKSGRMNITYSTFDSRDYTSGLATAINIELTKPLFRVKSVFIVKRVAANVTNIAVDSFALDPRYFFATDGTANTFYQFQHNSIFLPQSRVDSFERAYMEMKKSVGTMGDITYQVPFRKYKAPRALVDTGTGSICESIFIAALRIKINSFNESRPN
jgi:hypothetical protein